MKVVILAGGRGTRLSEETTVRPKPMVEIGEQPIMWHIMKIYSHYGFNDFVICLGYKGNVIKEYFYNYFIHESDIELNLATRDFKTLKNPPEQWKVTLVNTGLDTMTGGRIKRIKDHIGDETFMMTYGDGLSDLNIGSLVDYHKAHSKYATVTAVKPPGRFGAISLQENGLVSQFTEKPRGDGSFINGGFFVLEPAIFDYIEGDGTIWEQEPLRKLSRDNQLMAFRHDGFWKAMDTMRDKIELKNLWNSGNAPWKVWKS
jgi:glucose-1-phosphate cytidylyltransferase